MRLFFSPMNDPQLRHARSVLSSSLQLTLVWKMAPYRTIPRSPGLQAGFQVLLDGPLRSTSCMRRGSRTRTSTRVRKDLHHCGGLASEFKSRQHLTTLEGTATALPSLNSWLLPVATEMRQPRTRNQSRQNSIRRMAHPRRSTARQPTG